MKAALITGALGGIGEALCLTFLESGYTVIATDIHQPTIGTVNLAIDLAQFVIDDNYRVESLLQIKTALVNDSLNVLVNNAAIQILAPVEQLTLQQFQTSQNVNVVAPLLLTQALLSALERGKGSVINIASIHAQLTKPEFVAYATSKAALVGLTQALAVEVGARVRVNAISPAAIATPMLQAGFEGNSVAYTALKSHHPSGDIGRPEEVANLAVFLASNQARFINGANISISGAIDARLHDPV